MPPSLEFFTLEAAPGASDPLATTVVMRLGLKYMLKRFPREPDCAWASEVRLDAVLLLEVGLLAAGWTDGLVAGLGTVRRTTVPYGPVVVYVVPGARRAGDWFLLDIREPRTVSGRELYVDKDVREAVDCRFGNVGLNSATSSAVMPEPSALYEVAIPGSAPERSKRYDSALNHVS